jgi:hypothetical protein
MQIDKIRFNPFIEQEKQCQHINSLCLYYGEPGHVVCECPKKSCPHVVCAISVTNPQPEKLGNEHVQSQ